MKKLEDVGVLVARILMPILFIVAGWGKITGYAGTQQYMEAMGVPGFLLPLTILLEFGGGLAVLFGFLTRTTALFTAGFTVLTAFIFFFVLLREIPAIWFLGFWFLLQLVEGGFSVVQPQSGGGTAFFAHIGGFVFGLVTIRFLVKRPPLQPAW